MTQTKPSTLQTRPARRGPPPAAVFPTVREVLRAIGGDEPTRALAMKTFKAAGGSIDRWQHRDIEAMAQAITSAEDTEELRVKGRWNATRETLQTIRRRLEG